MFDSVRRFALHVLRVPPEPTPPWGAPESVRVFRAGSNFYKLRLLGWAGAQALTLAGIVFWVVMLDRWERDVDVARARASSEAVNGSASVAPRNLESGATAPAPAGEGKNRRSKRPRRNQAADEFAARAPLWAFPALRVLELIGLIAYFIQLPFTYALLRLDYEMRWYIVTDRSLRIRQGLWRVQESTMSFANLQQVGVTQGPLQRWLRLADLRVQSAGGGGAEEASRRRGDDLHTGVFHGVENASEIRDLILERLRQFRATGLGDPDELHASTRPGRTTDASEVLAAAQALLAEARQLRQELAG